MKSKTLINLFLILIIAILAIIARRTWQDKQTLKPNAYLQAVSTFPKDNISQIIISNQSDSLEFQKGNGGWTVDTHRASADAVNRLLNGLLPEISPLLISTTQKQLENLGVSSESATTVKLNSGDKSLTFFTNGSSVRLDNSLEVYTLNAMPSISFDLNSWADLKITSFNDGDIIKMTFPQFTLAKDDQGNWSADSEVKISQDAVKTYLSKLNPLTAQNLASEESLTKYNLNYPEFSLSLFGQTDNEIKLDFFASQDEYLVKRTIVNNSEEELFIITSSQAENLNKDLDTFIE